jgi:PII-like signaling protein
MRRFYSRSMEHRGVGIAGKIHYRKSSSLLTGAPAFLLPSVAARYNGHEAAAWAHPCWTWTGDPSPTTPPPFAWGWWLPADRGDPMETIEARKLTIYVGDEDKHCGKGLCRCVVNLLLDEGIAGATVLHGIEGYGSHKQIHTTKILDLTRHLPLVIVAVDLKEKIEAVLPKVTEMVEGGLVTVERVEIVSRVPTPA